MYYQDRQVPDQFSLAESSRQKIRPILCDVLERGCKNTRASQAVIEDLYIVRLGLRQLVAGLTM